MLDAEGLLSSVTSMAEITQTLDEFAETNSNGNIKADAESEKKEPEEEQEQVKTEVRLGNGATTEFVEPPSHPPLPKADPHELFYNILISTLMITLLLGPFLFILSPYAIAAVVALPLIISSLLYNYFRLSSVPSAAQFRHLTIAHRGGKPLLESDLVDHSDFPENSLAAYRWAATLSGCDALELDCWLSADGVPMVRNSSHTLFKFGD
jgi:hypothetical protein